MTSAAKLTKPQRRLLLALHRKGPGPVDRYDCGYPRGDMVHRLWKAGLLDYVDDGTRIYVFSGKLVLTEAGSRALDDGVRS